MTTNVDIPAGNSPPTLAGLAQLLSAFATSSKPAPAAPEGPPPELQEAVRRLIKISLAQDARGDHARAAWRKIAEGGLELIHALGEDTYVR